MAHPIFLLGGRRRQSQPIQSAMAHATPRPWEKSASAPTILAELRSRERHIQYALCKQRQQVQRAKATISNALAMMPVVSRTSFKMAGLVAWLFRLYRSFFDFERATRWSEQCVGGLAMLRPTMSQGSIPGRIQFGFVNVLLICVEYCRE